LLDLGCVRCCGVGMSAAWAKNGEVKRLGVLGTKVLTDKPICEWPC